jgi:hypothetical protein
MQIPLWHLDPAEDAGVQSDTPASPARTASVINARKVKPAT